MNDKQILYQAVCLWKNYIEQEYFVNKLESLKKEILDGKFTKEI